MLASVALYRLYDNAGKLVQEKDPYCSDSGTRLEHRLEVGSDSKSITTATRLTALYTVGPGKRRRQASRCTSGYCTIVVCAGWDEQSSKISDQRMTIRLAAGIFQDGLLLPNVG